VTHGTDQLQKGIPFEEGSEPSLAARIKSGGVHTVAGE